MSGPLYPDVHVPLVGEDGNAFSILGRAKRAMMQAGVEASQQAEYEKQATSGDYDNLLRVTMRWFDTTGEDY